MLAHALIVGFIASAASAQMEFREAVMYTFSDDASSGSVADIDLDKDIDVVVFHGRSPMALSVWTNDGSGSFGMKPMQYAEGPRFGAVLVDVDGNKCPDYLMPKGKLILNSGDGRPGLSRNFQTSNFAGSPIAGDLDSDGDMDFASPNQNDTVAVHLNDGSGDLSRFVEHSTGVRNGQPSDLAIADIDNDGTSDLVVALSAPGVSHGILIMKNSGSGVFHPSEVPTGISGARQSVLAGDFSGDGSIDVLTGGTVYSNNGKGVFEVMTKLAGFSGAVSTIIADLNGDSKLDAACLDQSGNIRISMNSGAGEFAGQPSIVALPGVKWRDRTQGVSLHVADFNSDEKLDLCVIYPDREVVVALHLAR